MRPASRCCRSRFIFQRSDERGAAVIKVVTFFAVVALVVAMILAISRQDYDADKQDANSAATPSSESPFEEVAQRAQEARHGVPTGVPLNPQDEHFLTGYEQMGLGVALVLAIGLASRKLTPGLGAVLMKRFNPWTSVAAPPQPAEEQFVAEFAVQLQVTERGLVEMARTREEIFAAFFQTAPAKLAELRSIFAGISGAQDAAARQKILNDLGTEVTGLKSRVGSLELTPAWHLASSVEKLLSQLREKPANITPSTLRTVAGGLLLLNDLCVPDIRKDLASSPPVRFLAVDDDPISRRAVSMSLKKVAQAPDLAEHGEAALELAARQAYDAVFLDVEMPGLDGFEVCTKLHQLEANRTTPVVFVTSHSDFESRAKSTSSGGRDLIAKPFISSEITLKALTLLLRGRLAREKINRELSKKESSAGAVKTPVSVLKSETNTPVVASEVTSKVPAIPDSANPPSDAKASPTKSEQKLQMPESTTRTTPSAREHAKAFAVHGPEHLREMQEQLATLSIVEKPEERQEILGELYVALNMVRSEAARAGLRTICELASALGKLVTKLMDKPALFPPSALQAISTAIRLLEELAPGGAEPDLANPPIRALVVDDDPLSRRAISNALQLTFGKPDSAENGQTAVALTQSKIFDVIFLDIMMPDMDGFETCSKIRETKLNGSTPIIFVTSHKDCESRDKAFDSGGNGFISKPVLPAEIFLTALTFALRARMAQSGAVAPAEQLEAVLC